MQKFLDNAVSWSLSLIGIFFFLGAVGCLILRGYVFLRYGQNPEMPISLVAGRYHFDWVGIQMIVDFFLGFPIEFGLIALGILFISWAGSADS